jgi:hypothetical protein
LKNFSATVIFLSGFSEHSENCDGAQPQGPSRGTAGQVSFFMKEWKSLIRLGDAPSGAAAVIALRFEKR